MSKSEIALIVLLILVGIAILFVIWISPWMTYRYGPGQQTGYGPGYWMGPQMMYGYGPSYGINTTSPQIGYGPGYWMGPQMMYGYRPSNPKSIADELNKLAALKKDGLITDNEYAQLKSQLINKSFS